MKSTRVSTGLLAVAVLVLVAMAHAAAGRGPQVKPAQPPKPPVAGGVCRADAPEFDARRLGVVPSPRNQVGCGSCWAFGSAAAFEISYGIMNPDVRPAGIDVSEQHIMSCSIGSCDGSSAESALRWMKDHRIARESQLVYYDGQRQTLRSGSFPVGREKEISIPCDATNVRVHAKAIAGRDIFTKTYPKAEDACFTVKGTTLRPRYEGC